MRQNRIALVTVGTLRPLDIAFLEHWQSALFEVHHSGTIAYTPDAHGKSWTYTDDQLHQMIRPDAASAFTLAVVNAPLEQNYYSRRLADNLVVVSLFEIGDILSGANHRLEHFVLRAAYVHAIYRFLFAGRIPLTVERH